MEYYFPSRIDWRFILGLYTNLQQVLLPTLCSGLTCQRRTCLNSLGLIPSATSCLLFRTKGIGLDFNYRFSRQILIACSRSLGMPVGRKKWGPCYPTPPVEELLCKSVQCRAPHLKGRAETTITDPALDQRTFSSCPEAQLVHAEIWTREDHQI